jgi:hypothetical protein
MADGYTPLSSANNNLAIDQSLGSVDDGQIEGTANVNAVL